VLTDDEPQTTATRYDWERIVRRARLGAPTKAVALAMATYADRDGSRVYPGVARLAAVTELSERSVRGALKKLRDVGLIERTFSGGHRGVQSFTDVHRLAIPVDLFEVVEMLDPAELHGSQPAPGAAQPAGGAAQAARGASQPAPGAPHQVLTNHQPTHLQTDDLSFGTEVQNAHANVGGNVVAMNGWGGRR
jgi:DNA-binding transcriptional ArsR family regulator